MANSWKFTLSALMCAITLGANAQVTESALPFLNLTAQQQAALGIQVSKIQAADSTQVLASALVNAQPGKDITVSAPYAGQISRLNVGIGDRVQVGKTLADFTSPQLAEARRQLQEAKLEFQNATSALQRDEAMLAEGIIPAVRVQITRNKFEAAQVAMQTREAEIKAGHIALNSPTDGLATGGLQAPIRGVVTQLLGSVGQRVDAGAVLFKLADDSALQLEIQLSSEKANALQVGDLIQIPSRQAQAKVVGISRAADASQSAQARAIVLQRGRLQVGEWVAVTIQSQIKAADKTSSHWSVPTRSVVHFGNQTLVFIRNAKGFEPHAVRVISNNDDVSLIEANLQADSLVAQSGLASLRAMLQKDE
jgi:cobalt-zinc-cadmium efflux system membrane fusion protein